MSTVCAMQIGLPIVRLQAWPARPSAGTSTAPSWKEWKHDLRLIEVSWADLQACNSSKSFPRLDTGGRQ
jgi:hypothetical protein